MIDKITNCDTYNRHLTKSLTVGILAKDIVS